MGETVLNDDDVSADSASNHLQGHYHNNENNQNSNNSDNESFTVNDDFVSFPTIADPENEHSKTLTKIFSKTLRKVTNNASTLVQNYASPKQGWSPNDHHNDDIHNVDKIYTEAPILDTAPIIPKELNPSLNFRNFYNNGNNNAKNISSKLHASSSIKSFDSHDIPSNIQNTSIDSLQISTPSRLDFMNNERLNNALDLGRDSMQDDKYKPKSQKLSMPQSSSTSSDDLQLRSDEIPRVTSDSNTLRLSTMQLPKLQPASNIRSVTSSVVNVNAIASTDTDQIKLSSSDKRDVSTKASNSQADQNKSHKTALESNSDSNLQNSLQNKISSIFNNLPNDFELSDDSASDIETINNASSSSSPNHAVQHNNQQFLSANETSMSSEQISIPSPIKVERGRPVLKSSGVQSNTNSPTLSTFHALRNINDLGNGPGTGTSSYSSMMRKKPSSNLSSVLFDNAKSLINNNIPGVVVSSASSMVTAKTKKKKKKPKRLSENPLKNGGIPKKYWMNDAFVSDCLNCFKAFSAFRRKHHCRFCGQIFCSDCTLFISYNQHKEERRSKIPDRRQPHEHHKTFNDKLRVCKPCYDDVIVYLSDDSSSSSESEDEHYIEEDPANDVEVPSIDNGQMPDHPLSRIRSLSINSRRDSLLSESTMIAANKLHLNKESKSSLNGTNQHNNNDINFNNFKNTTTSPVSNPALATEVSTPTSLKAIGLNAHGTSAGHYESPKYVSKQAPQMAIPTTRKGVALEIPVAKNSYSTIANAKNNLAMLALNNSTNNNMITGSLPSGESNDLNVKGNWFKNHSKHNASNTSQLELTRSNSLDNFSHIYENFMGRRNLERTYKNHSSSNKDLNVLKSKRSDLLLGSDENSKNYFGNYSDDVSDTENEYPEDIESENEDEQVMSLYTSLNNSDPRPVITSNSASVVPTLSEFPTMSAIEKRFPRGFNIPKTLTGASFLEERPKSESKSNERAHASLMRMQSRRKGRSVKNILVSTQANNKIHNAETSHIFYSPSPVSTPTSPTPNLSNLTKVLSNESTNLMALNSFPSYGNLDTVEQSLVNNTINSTPGTPKITSSDYSKDTFQESSENFLPNDLDNMEIPLTNDTLMPPTYLTHLSAVSTDKRYEDLLDHILKQSLEDCDIHDDQQKWCNTLKKLLTTIDQLKITDTLDIKQYVKIKKILGGKIGQSSIVDGMFLTKNIDSKRMSSKIENPKIALLMFPIEYLKQKEQFISLRIVHSQQAVYITNLVSRLISLEPDVVVVGDTVCGLAEKLLEDAHITVLSNVKPQVVERISRYTKADIFQSINDLFFKKSILGSCKTFEVKKYLYQNLVKTFTYFTGSDLESGFTIALRGGDEELLNSVKYAAETLISAVLNARFEKGLLGDHGLGFVKSEENSILTLFNHLNDLRKGNEIMDDVLISTTTALDNHEIGNYIKLFDDRKISTSPAVQFSLPMPLLNVVDAYETFNKFHQVNYRIQHATDMDEIDAQWYEELKLNIDVAKLPNGQADLLTILKFTSDFNLKSLTQDFQSRIRIWSNCMKYTSYQLYPLFHKKIHFLHSTVSIKHATPCTGPSIILVEYYTDNDKSLGWYLDQIFKESSRNCDECGDSLINHYKTYVHGSKKMDLIIERYDNLSYDQDFKGKNQRVMWSSCKECNHSTPIVTMSEETCFLSIGKFFELCFWGEGVYLSDERCPHDFFKNHIRYFAYNDLVIRIELSDIDNYEVVVPKKKLEFIPEIDIKLKLESFNNIQTKTSVFFQSILKRLNRVKVDTFDKAEVGIKKVQDLKVKLDEQIERINDKTLSIYNSTSPTVHLPLNSILRDLQELGMEWDNEFNEFEKNFLPSENEITRITQFHLKNFLMDKYSSDGQTKEVELNDMSKGNTEKSQGKEVNKDEGQSENELKTEKERENDNNHDNELTTNTSLKGDESNNETDMAPKGDFPMESFKPSEPTVIKPQQPNIVEKIHKMEKLLEQERLSGNNIGEEKKIKPPTRKISLSVIGKDGINVTPNGSISGPSISLEPQRPTLQSQPSLQFQKFESFNQSHQTTNQERAFATLNDNQQQEEHQLQELQQQQQEQEQPSQPTTKPPLQSALSKVLDLAKYYNEMNLTQLSKEFKERRERELSEKRSNKIKANPIVASKPIVEIYNKIEDVVDVNDDNLEDKRYPGIKKLNKSGTDNSQISQRPSESVMLANKNRPGEKSTSQFPNKSQASIEVTLQDQMSKEHIVPNIKKEMEKEVNKEANIEKLDIPQPEKNSLLKSLTNFWADRSATLWDPLEYPLESTEHTFADSDVIVREDEPSSLVAFCLSSNDYKQKMKSMVEDKDIVADNNEVYDGNNNNNESLANGRNGDEEDMAKGNNNNHTNNDVNTDTNANNNVNGDNDNNAHVLPNANSSHKGNNNENKDENIEINELTNKKINNFTKIEKKFKKNNTGDYVVNKLEQVMTKNKSNHLKYQYLDGTTNLSCKIFYSEQFEAFRKSCGVGDNFIQSLSRCVKWDSSGGKSGSNFLKTLDNRYIVKELSKLELESFVSIAPFYFKYISQSMFNTLTTAIAKIFGFYQIHIKNTITGKIFRMDFLIMENLFYNHKTTRIFDLKGSMRNRHVKQTGKENEVLLDENMIEYIYESPVFVKEQLKKLLRGSLFNDTSFLSAMDVMDYSLVIGIDDKLNKLYIGIIDWLRTFTWDKKVENWVKGNSLVGGGKKGKDPTIVTPKQYRIRFREAMERYILEVPDVWYEGK